MSTLKGTTMDPGCRHKVHVETYLNVDFSSSAQVKIQVKFNFKLFFEKKNQIFWFPFCSTREDISIDISITRAGINRTDINEARTISFISVRKLGVRTKFNLVNFKLFEFFSNSWVSML